MLAGNCRQRFVILREALLIPGGNFRRCLYIVRNHRRAGVKHTVDHRFHKPVVRSRNVPHQLDRASCSGLRAVLTVVRGKRFENFLRRAAFILQRSQVHVLKQEHCLIRLHGFRHCSPPECISRSLWARGAHWAYPGLHCLIRCTNPSFVSWEKAAILDRAEEEMPGDIDGCVDHGGGENQAGLAPPPAVEKDGDGGQNHVAPDGKAHVGDVREAEENGSGPPAGRIALGCSRKHVLQQAAEEKLFWPRREKQNANRQKLERFPLPPLRRKFAEVHGPPQRNRNATQNDEPPPNEAAPTAAPADRIADAVDATEKQETRKRNVYAEKHGKNEGEAPALVRPQPVRQRPSPGIRQGLHRYPYARENEEALPGTRRLGLGGGSQRQRNENETGDGGRTRERESNCTQAVNQVDKEHRLADEGAAAGPET